MRNAKRLYQEKGTETTPLNLKEEFADVLNYLLDLANYYHVDLEQAFREKDQINRNRKWK